jgi:hypothetical protein
MSFARSSQILLSTALAAALLQGGASAGDLMTVTPKPGTSLAEKSTVKKPQGLVVKKLSGNTGIDLVVKSILPDPDPIEGLPNQGYCYKWPVGGAANRVIFAVRNQGSAAAPASTARIQFDGAGSVDAAIIALAPGQERDVEVGIPAGCYPPGFSQACTYTITVDAVSAVAESIESNNQVESLCLQPAG